MIVAIPLRFLVARTMHRPAPTVAVVLVSALAMAAGGLAVSMAHGIDGTWLRTADRRTAKLISRSASGPETSTLSDDLVARMVPELTPFARVGSVGPLISPEMLFEARLLVQPERAEELESDDPFAVDLDDADAIARAEEARARQRSAPLVRARAVRDVAWLLHPGIRLRAGRVCERPGEAVIGALVARQLGIDSRELAIGRRFRMLDQQWTVVGWFEARGQAVEGEVWCSADTVAGIRPWSVVQVALRDPLSAVAGTQGADERPPGGVWSLVQDHRDDWAVRLDTTGTSASETAWYRAGTFVLAISATLVVALLAAALLGMIWLSITWDRRGDIGLLTRTGSSVSMLEWQVTIQALVPVAIGVVPGLIVTAACHSVPVRLGATIFRLDVTASAVLAGLGAVAVAAVIGLIPTWRLTRRLIAAESRPLHR